MTEHEMAELVRDIDEMAQRVGCRFYPDPEKVKSMTVQRIRRDIMPVKQAIAEMEQNADKISGMVVLVCQNNDEDYDYYVAGTIGAERAVGRLEIIKRAILDKVQF